MGSCVTGGVGGGGPATISVAGKNWMTTDLPGFYQWKRKTSDAWTAYWDGNGPDSGDPCTAAYPTTRMPDSGELSALTLADIGTLGLSMNGYREEINGTVNLPGAGGFYWSSSQ